MQKIRIKLMGKHKIPREMRIEEGRRIRKYMNKRHRIEEKISRVRETEFLARFRTKRSNAY
jgi:hypothetical protein